MELIVNILEYLESVLLSGVKLNWEFFASKENLEGREAHVTLMDVYSL